MTARIVVSRQLPEPALEILRAAGDVWLSPHDRPLTVAELHAAVAGADAAVTLLHDRVDDAFLAAAGPGLRVVANVAVGYDNIDVAACARRGVVCTNTPGVLVESTADIAFALILMATRRLGEAERMVRSGATWSWSMFYMLGMGLQDKTLGIVGPRQDRHRDGPPGAGVRDADRLRRPAPGGRGARGGARRGDARAGRAARGRGRRLDPLPAIRRDAAPDRRPPPGADEADGLSGEHGPRPDRRRGRAGRGPACGRDRGRRPGRVRARAGRRAGPARARERRAAPAPGLGDDRDPHRDGRAGGAATLRRCSRASRRSRRSPE